MSPARRRREGVGDGMEQRVRVGMAEQPRGVGNLDAAEDELAAGDELVYRRSPVDTKKFIAVPAVSIRRSRDRPEK